MNSFWPVDEIFFIDQDGWTVKSINIIAKMAEASESLCGYKTNIVTTAESTSSSVSPTGSIILEVKTEEGQPVEGSVSLATKELPVISIQDYLNNQKQIEIPLKIETIQIYTQEDKAEVPAID